MDLVCPGCGAPLRERFRGPELIACEHCGAFVAIVDGVGSLVAKGAPLLAMPTRFALGTSVRLRGVAHDCVGHVRFEYEDGSWDEWQLVRPDGSIARLQEDEGDLVLWNSADDGARVELSAARPGGTVAAFGLAVRVSEIGRARVVGAEGSLERRVTPAEPFDYVDGHAAGGVVSIRTGASSSLCLRGDPIAHEEIET